MPTVDMPALDGRDQLGFLAALGVTRLIDDARLSFNTETFTAQLHSRHADIDGIAEELRTIVADLKDGALLPGITAGFPVPSALSGGDPMRTPRLSFPDFSRKHAEAADWIPSLVTDLVTDNDQRVKISLFQAPAGSQAMATMFTKPLEHIHKDPEHLRTALTGWRRVKDVTGEYLDHRAQSNAADNPTGKAIMNGAPGPTWLALMAFPYTTVTSINGRQPDASGWHRPHPRRAPILAWPLWKQPLTPRAITTLLEHPAITLDTDHTGKTILTTKPTILTELGIFHICAARRRKLDGGKSDGILAPHPLTHTPPTKPTTPTIL